MLTDHQGFFASAGPIPLSEIVGAVGGELSGDQAALADRPIRSIAPLGDARTDDLTFLDNTRYLDELETTAAAACLVKPAFADRVPSGTAAVLTPAPYHAFAKAIARLYPGARHSPVLAADADNAIDPSARIEDGVVIEPGAVIGPEVEIGRGTRVSTGAVIGYRCAIGRDCFIGPNVTIVCGLLGDRVIVHPGVRIGQDGFGFAMGPTGHLKVPQIGRVIIQDDVEIGANSTIDRGALRDTVIGEGSKIDNLVQIGHNVTLGRHCIIVAQVGISGSTKLGDFVVMGGHAGAVGHLAIGDGAMIAGASHVKNDIPAGQRVGGTPARPFREWAREIAAVKRLGQSRAKKS
ncbi:MAG: UDP-3-O-(3-hydroxymyristoyl)glucosamine N-acyltransferase [Pseudomonadota bacterium]